MLGFIGIEKGAERDAEHLATLVERDFHDALEKFLVAAERGDAISREADDGRLHLGRRIEHRGLDGEEIFHIVPRLHEYGEDAVGFRARAGGHAQGHFVLDHARATGDELAIVEHLEENLRGDIVGIVAREHEFPAFKRLVEIHAEEITFDNREYGGAEVRGGEIVLEVFYTFAVDFHGFQLALFLSEKLREDTHSRPYFKDGDVGTGIDRVGDAAGNVQVAEEVLPEIFLGFYLFHDCKVTVK